MATSTPMDWLKGRLALLFKQH